MFFFSLSQDLATFFYYTLHWKSFMQITQFWYIWLKIWVLAAYKKKDEEDKCLIFKYIFDPHWAKNTIIIYFYYDNDQCAFYFTFLEFQYHVT